MTSPGFTARAGGFFYLVMILFGAVATYAKKIIVVSNDAAATVANILAHRSWFEVWYASELLVVVTYVVVTALFFQIFKPVSHGVTWLATFFSLIGCATQALTSVFRIAPVVIANSASLSAAQVQAMTTLSFKLYGQAYGIGLVFFACYFVVLGYLTFKSTFLPRTLGVFVTIAGLGWLTFLSPTLASHLFPRVLLPLAALGEGGLMLWLLVMGVNVQRWNEQAAIAEASAGRGPSDPRRPA